MSLTAIPEGDGEHPLQTTHKVEAMTLIEVRNHLDVTAGPQGDALGIQLGREVAVVVDLPIAHRDRGSVVRIPAGGQPNQQSRTQLSAANGGKENSWNT